MSGDRLRLRMMPFVVTAVIVITGMLHSFYWLGFAYGGRSGRYWFVPNDIWGTYNVAMTISQGHYGNLYGASSGFLTTPGIALLLAPIARMGAHFNLIEYAFFTPSSHPTAWLVLGPVEMVLGGFCLFGFDALAERMGVASRKRVLLCLCEGALLWPLTALWGHPEDGVAIGFAAYAIVAVFDGKWKKAAWLVGIGIAFQPLIVLVVPLMVGRFGLRRTVPVVSRAALPAALLLAVPFINQFHLTWRAVVQQPTDVFFAHVTPWTAVAPHLPGHYVSCGPTRLVAMLATCAIGWWTIKHRVDDPTFLWLAGLCLGLRFLAESALESYYIWPALALLVIAAAARGRRQFLPATVFAILVTCATNVNFGPWWVWWGVMVLGLMFVVATSFSRSVSPDDIVDNAVDEVEIHADATTESFSPPPVPALI
jgi:hypothetical protein